MTKKESCGCKSDYITTTDTTKQNDPMDDAKGFMKAYVWITSVLVNTIIFIITLPLTLLVVIPFSVYMVFRLIYLRDGGVNFKESLTNLGQALAKLNNGEDVEEDEPFYDFDENLEYKLVDVDYAENKSIN